MTTMAPSLAIQNHNLGIYNYPPRLGPNLESSLIPSSDRHLQTGRLQCPSETCHAPLCDCALEFKNSFDCAEHLDAVCRNETISECVSPEDLFYMEKLSCPFAECAVEGGTLTSCRCDFFATFCDTYSAFLDDPGYEIIRTYCDISVCCQDLNNATALEEGDDPRSVCLLNSPSGMPSAAPSDLVITLTSAPPSPLPTSLANNTLSSPSDGPTAAKGGITATLSVTQDIIATNSPTNPPMNSPTTPPSLSPMASSSLSPIETSSTDSPSSGASKKLISVLYAVAAISLFFTAVALFQ